MEFMKTSQNLFVSSSFRLHAALAVFILSIATVPKLFAQTNAWPQNAIGIPIVANNPSAMNLVSNLMTEPQPALSVPEVSGTNSGPEGTYWVLTQGVPMPFDPYPDLQVFQIGTNANFLIDDRSVDYAGLTAQGEAESEANPITNPPISISSIDTNGLWIQVPTNSLATQVNFAVSLMNTLEDQSYDVLTTPYLPGLWATELTVTGSVGNVTPATVPKNGRTNLFVWARTSAAYSFYLVTEPLSQDVGDGDDVTFMVATGGNANLSYQWTLDGNPIAGATNSTYTIYGVQDGDAGHYACIVSDGLNSIVTGAAKLTTEAYWGDPLIIPVVSSRQNYRFRSGFTYYIGGPIQLFGNTTIEAGSTLKLDYDNYTNTSLIIEGGLTCKTEPYNPAILTTIDDDAAGEFLPFDTVPPQTVYAGVPYLDLTSSTSNSVSNLRFLFADWAITTPVNTPQLDVWDCQFVNCNYGVVNLSEGDSVDRLHNVLFAGCQAAVGASSNSISIRGEHVTADVEDFCLSETAPNLIALTNSILWGNPLSASSVSTVNVAIKPDNTNFVSAGQGNYYLAPNSPLHNTGTANISPRLQAEFQHKTTYAPLALPFALQITGDLTLCPQAPRFTNGSPDYGYYYDALDYTAASLLINGGRLTILPGTAIGFRNDDIIYAGYWSIYGCEVSRSGTVISHGMPIKPNVFTSLDRVQETPNLAFAEFVREYSIGAGVLLPEMCSFVTDLEPEDAGPPSLDFRFSQFYLPGGNIHICGGVSFDGAWGFSSSSGVNLTLQDCGVHNGQIDLGQPDLVNYGEDQVYGSGAVRWINTLFENVNINLDPTYNEDGGDDRGLNVDMSFQANNNLFRGGLWLHLEPVPASTGDWLFENNLFDQVNFIQDTSQPLDFAYNGYWPMPDHLAAWDATLNMWALANTNSLQPTTTTNGFSDAANEQFLSAAPPFQTGPFGNYYLPNSTLLYDAGSTNAAALGLYHYTTQTNQFKEGNELTGHKVNIGLHYVAADASRKPVDFDGDGIPDYAENWHGDGNYLAHTNSETDWKNAITDGTNADPSNSVYLDIDLSGDGLVGRVKRALNMNPLDPGNPLALNQIITGQEPDVATYEVPIKYATLTNAGSLNLRLETQSATLQDIVPAPDGNCLLRWNTDYETPGQHFLQPEFDYGGPVDDTQPGTYSGQGSLTTFNSPNALQFFEQTSMFQYNVGAVLYAQAPGLSGNSYTIELRDLNDPASPHIKTISGNVASDVILTSWDLTYDDGVTQFTGDSVAAVYTVFALTNRQTTNTQNLTSTVGLKDGNFDAAYAYNPSPVIGNPGGVYGAFWIQMQKVVNTLVAPQTTDFGSPNNYNSTFDYYTSQGGNPHGNGTSEGWPGYLADRTTATNLLNDLANPATENFFFYGHGTPKYLFDGQTNAPGYLSGAYLSVDEVSARLTNSLADDAIQGKHPYRFVFLDACETAKTPAWQRAFGIYAPANSDLPQTIIGAQAFLGWDGQTGGIADSNGVVQENWANAYGNTINLFYRQWMNKVPLANCIAAASSAGAYPFPVKGNEHVMITLGPSGSSFVTVQTSNLKLTGSRGLKRDGVDYNIP
jgi:hypothetical protein